MADSTGGVSEEVRALLSQTTVNRQNLRAYEYLRSDVQLTDNVLGQGNFCKVTVAVLREKNGKKSNVVAKETVEQASDEATARLTKDMIAEFNIMFHQCAYHPYIVQAIGHTVGSGKIPLLLLEYVDGGTDIGKLRQTLFTVNDDVDASTKTRWLYEVSRGVDHLHNLDIVHRDLAVRNVIVSRKSNGEYGCAKITDFGLARKLDANGTYLAGLQEPFPTRYTAPESLQQPLWSKPNDSWSMGVVIWEIFHSNPNDKPYGLDIVNRRIMLAVIVEQGVRLGLSGEAPESIVEVMQECFDLNASSRPSMLVLAERFRQSHGDLSISISADQVQE